MLDFEILRGMLFEHQEVRRIISEQFQDGEKRLEQYRKQLEVTERRINAIATLMKMIDAKEFSDLIREMQNDQMREAFGTDELINGV